MLDNYNEKLYPIGTVISYKYRPEMVGYVIGYKHRWISVRFFNDEWVTGDGLFDGTEITVLTAKG
jgi:hypothetical protein